MAIGSVEISLVKNKLKPIYIAKIEPERKKIRITKSKSEPVEF